MADRTGEYIEMCWGDYDAEFEAIRGHVSIDNALQAMEGMMGSVVRDYDWDSEWLYARWCPRVGRDYDSELVLCEKGPGAFAVTICKEKVA